MVTLAKHSYRGNKWTYSVIPRYTADQLTYIARKGVDWPPFDKFQQMNFTELSSNIVGEIIALVNENPKFHSSLLPILNVPFDGADSAESQSQSWQDIFVLTMLNGKKNGTYLEIGAGDPIQNNNTYLLSKFGYTGISIDKKPLLKWGQYRKTGFYLGTTDALTCDFRDILKKYNLPTQIDYLQLDIDPEVNTFSALKRLPHDKYRFSVITYETDIFFGRTDIAEQSREFLQNLGYELLVKNVGVKIFMEDHPAYNTWAAFEDWYVDPKVVNSELINKFKDISDTVKLPHKIFCNLEV